MAERIWFTIEDGMRSRLMEMAEARGVSRDELANTLLARGYADCAERSDAEMYAPPAPQAPAVPDPPTLDEAADVILRHLPDHQRALILDCCAETGRQPIEYILSYIHLADERGETAMVMSEQLRDEAIPALLPPDRQGICEYDGCRKPFQPTKRGQRFCPEPEDGSESCGRKATLQDLHRRRPQGPAGGVGPAKTQPPVPMQLDTQVYQRAAGLLAQAK